MPLYTLRTLLEDKREVVASQAGDVLSHLKARVPNADTFLDRDISDVVAAMAAKRRFIPDHSSQLSEIYAVLVPLLELHRAVHIAQPVEEQLEPSELDLLDFGVTQADFVRVAEELGTVYLSESSKAEPTKGLVVGVKKRIVVVRNITIKRKTLSVAFVLDTGAPVSWIRHETLRAFGVDPELAAANYVRGTFGGTLSLDLYLLDPTGIHKELNILGMDYMLETNARLQFDMRGKCVELAVSY